MTATPGNRKRGRPKKQTINFDSVGVTTPRLNSLINIQGEPLNSQDSDVESTELLTQVEIEDWSSELDGGSTPSNLELLEFTEVKDQRDELETNRREAFAEHSINDKTSDSSRSLMSVNGFVPPQDRYTDKQSTTIHIIDGEKGGCGKSFFCRTFIEYCASIGYEAAIVDADTSNQDISKIYPRVEVAFFSDDDKQAQEADKIFDLAFERSVIVNLPAQVYHNVTNWIKRNDLTELGHEHSITFIKWFVCTGGVDSVNFFLKSLDDLGEMMTHVFVRNLGLCDDWKYIEEMTEFEQARNQYQFTIVDFPKFPFWERNMVDRLESTFSGVLSHPEFKVVSKQRVKNFLKEAYNAIALTGLVK